MAQDLDLDTLTPEQLAALHDKVVAAKRERKDHESRVAAADRMARAKAAVRPVPKRSGRGGVSLKPSDKPDQALEQMRKSFGAQWIDDPANPAVALVQCEAQHCARLNIYHEGKWTSRRLGTDAVVALVKLTDGTEETRKFERDILNADWKRS